MPTPRVGFAVAAHQGTLYTFGGSGAFNDVVEAFEPATNQWSTRQRLSWGFTRGLAVTLGDRIYVVGYRPEGFATAYDPLSDTWTSLAQPPLLVLNHGINVTGGAIANRLFLVDGSSGRLFVYDPDRDAWTEGPASPISGALSATTAQSALYAIATSYPAPAEFARYDACSKAWGSLPHHGSKVPFEQVSAANIVALGKYLLAVGGEHAVWDPLNQGWADVESVDLYEPGALDWRSVAPMASGRHSAGLVEVGGRVYVMGGAVGHYPEVAVGWVDEGVFQ